MRPEALGVTRPEGTEGSFELVAIGALERLLSGGVNLAGCECNIQYIGGALDADAIGQSSARRAAPLSTHFRALRGPG